MILTNGHCLYQGKIHGEYPGPGEVFFHAKSTTTGGTLNTGNPEAPEFHLEITELLYGTMTDTDIGLYLTQESYQDIQRQTATLPFILAKNVRTTLTLGARIRLTSSYWRDSSTCVFEKNVEKMREGEWTWGPSMKLSTDCKVQHGSSGSPLILEGTRLIVGVINTMYEAGEACAENSPCEVGADGTTSIANTSQPYGQFVDAIYTCLGPNRELDLSVTGCILPKP